MAVELPARGVRVGGVSVAPGEARAVSIPLALPARARAAGAAERAVPAWVIVGNKPGPRISVVAAVHGVEATAARAATRLAASLDPGALAGSVVVVPVLRAGGRLAAANRPRAQLSFPGDAAGKRAARDAFALFSDVVVGAQALIVLGGPRRERRGPVVARGRLDDPRVRRLAMQSGAAALLPARPGGNLLAAAGAAQVVAVELSAAGASVDAAAAEPLVRSARALLVALGVLTANDRPAGGGGEGGGWPASRRAGLVGRAGLAGVARLGGRGVVARAVRVRAPTDGFLEAAAAPGSVVRARALLGRIEPVLPGPSAALVAPIGGIVIEAAGTGFVRAGAILFAIVPSPSPSRRDPPADSAPEKPAEIDGKTRIGWVEHVALPRLEIKRLKAKIDTGARTSALHVMRMRTIDTAGGPNRRPILEITVPGGRRGERPHVVRATVRGFAMVRDTSGRTERRPVIETALRLGPFERRITLTLTDRGDMLFPMLVGRTALGPGVVVDPSRRYLLGRTRHRSGGRAIN
jgi:predicted deacylase